MRTRGFRYKDGRNEDRPDRCGASRKCYNEVAGVVEFEIKTKHGTGPWVKRQMNVCNGHRRLLTRKLTLVRNTEP